jgi:spore germination protein PC
MQEPNAHSPWQAWAMDVQGRLSEQQRCIDKLQRQVDALCAQVQQLEARPTYNVEKIEYRFDQLKVEQLA